AGGDDLIVKPIPMRDLQVRVRALLRLKELRGDLRSTQESLRELVKRENPTESKAPFDDSVALTAQALARLIGLDAEDQEVAYHAGLLHDIGQIGLSKALEILAAGSGAQWDPRLTAAFATSSLPQRIAGAAQDDEVKIA